MQLRHWPRLGQHFRTNHWMESGTPCCTVTLSTVMADRLTYAAIYIPGYDFALGDTGRAQALKASDWPRSPCDDNCRFDWLRIDNS